MSFTQKLEFAKLFNVLIEGIKIIQTKKNCEFLSEENTIKTQYSQLEFKDFTGDDQK